MLYLDKNQTDGAAYVCEVIDRGNGRIALKDVNDGLYLSCDPDSGRLEKRQDIGPWEECQRGKHGIVFDVDWNGRKAHLFAYDEV